MKKIMLFIMTISLFALPLNGCRDSNELEDLALVMGIGVDLTEDEHPLVSLQVFLPQGSGQSGGSQSQSKGAGGANQSFIATESGQSIGDAVNKIAKRMSRRVYLSHNAVLIISERMANHRLREVIDYCQRTQEIRQRTLLFVTREDMPKILNYESVLEKTSSISLLKEEEKHLNLITTIRDVSLMKTGPNKPIAIPVIKLRRDSYDPREQVTKIIGSALFTDEQMVGMMNSERTLGILMMNGDFRNNTFTFKPKGRKGKLSVNVQDIRIRAVPTIDRGSWELSIHLSGKGMLQENTTTLNPMNPVDCRQIEKQTAKYLASMIGKGFKQSQCVGSDVYMTYEVFERSYPHECQRAREHWATVYPNIHLSVHPQIQLMHSGASNS
ncbi:hypothetical protein SINU_00295 [Sporolactobacillus inulinus CASD]|uniref:Uncharacterized protein n=1 Tax=Sporolactobacillus inulinus CASD TaxID=1069536 RepID=A0A0U1QSX4_9BACL|nr:Ger(x)C family spore germination protein [Sporolactobacillus inulinus]KLI03901.1 hypothetical protein SINU_00295 [Sporolactobacillus inulinus CASD]